MKIYLGNNIERQTDQICSLTIKNRNVKFFPLLIDKFNILIHVVIFSSI